MTMTFDYRRIHFVFAFLFKFGNPAEVWKTMALICTRKQQTKGFSGSCHKMTSSRNFPIVRLMSKCLNKSVNRIVLIWCYGSPISQFSWNWTQISLHVMQSWCIMVRHQKNVLIQKKSLAKHNLYYPINISCHDNTLSLKDSDNFFTLPIQIDRFKCTTATKSVNSNCNGKPWLRSTVHFIAHQPYLTECSEPE